jgi:hypothetical protein
MKVVPAQKQPAVRNHRPTNIKSKHQSQSLEASQNLKISAWAYHTGIYISAVDLPSNLHHGLTRVISPKARARRVYCLNFLNAHTLLVDVSE